MSSRRLRKGGSTPAAAAAATAPAGPISSRVTVEDIVALAAASGLTQFREPISSAFFFENEAHERITVYHTTGAVRTDLNHPTQGPNTLFRGSPYADLAELAEIFKDFRLHTGKGYRRAVAAPWHCTACHQVLVRANFSAAQWRKRSSNTQVCIQCSGGETSAEDRDVSAVTAGLERLRVAALRCADCGVERRREDFSGNQWSRRDTGSARCKACVPAGGRPASAPAPVPVPAPAPARPAVATLTEGNLQRLDRTTGALERRQFCCPAHRPPAAFFKQVPVHKPVASCPSCRGRGAKRLQAVPRDQERGYGLFRCPECRASWGSSRAGRGLGMFCVNPTCGYCLKGEAIYPFRIETPKPRTTVQAAYGGSRRRARPPPMPRNPEEAPVDHGTADRAAPFTASDPRGYSGRTAGRASESSEGSWQLVGGSQDSADEGPEQSAPVAAASVSANTHRCTGCATGECSRRLPPVSAYHDSTGSTASTSSCRTFSTIDLNEYRDRDAPAEMHA